jgi:hypothetical protein
MKKQKKLELLVKNYIKLEENRKDYIQKLLRKLVKIHCGRGLPVNTVSKGGIEGDNFEIYLA